MLTVFLITPIGLIFMPDLDLAAFEIFEYSGFDCFNDFRVREIFV